MNSKVEPDHHDDCAGKCGIHIAKPGRQMSLPPQTPEDPIDWPLIWLEEEVPQQARSCYRQDLRGEQCAPVDLRDESIPAAEYCQSQGQRYRGKCGKRNRPIHPKCVPES